MDNKKILYIVIFMHTIFFMFAIGFLKIQKDKNISKYLNEFYISNQKTFNKEINILNKNMDLLENILIDKDVLKIINNAQKNLEKYRKELIKIFTPKYKTLKNNGFYLIHFHLSDGTSFVRFHNINKFNDYLFDFRPSIKYVQTTKNIFHGFEIGKGVGGFRSIYPLIYNNKIIGSFEISFSIDNLIEYMFAKEHIALVVKKDLINKRVFKQDINKFKQCKLNNEYYIWGNGCQLFKNKHFINFNKKINIVENNVIFAYPIYDIHKQKEGYLLSIFPLKDLKIIAEINNGFKTMIVIVLILYAVILMIIFGIYFYKQMKIKSETDHLTKTLNRNGCLRKLKNVNKYALLIIDIDHFKKINDTYGHDIGDLVLTKLSTILDTHIRKDDILCRWGGEEFLIILPNTSLDSSIKVANKLRELVKEHKFNDINITISIGIAMFNGNFDETFKKADNNLYTAKKSGRDKVIYR